MWASRISFASARCMLYSTYTAALTTSQPPKRANACQPRLPVQAQPTTCWQQHPLRWLPHHMPITPVAGRHAPGCGAAFRQHSAFHFTHL